MIKGDSSFVYLQIISPVSIEIVSSVYQRSTDAIAFTNIFPSYAGLTEISTNKPEIDEDEEEDEDHWKDASPVTPICSPARRPAKLYQRDKRSPTRYVDVDNDVEIIHEFYPTTSKTMREETSIVSYGGTIIVETTRIPRHIKDVPTRMEKVAPKVKLKKQSSLELDRVPPVQEEPSSSAEEASRITATTRSMREADQERRKSLKRHSSAESEGRTSTSKETLEKSDTSSEKGAKKKVFAEKRDSKKRSRKSGKRSVKAERKVEEDSSRRKLEGEEFARKDEETYRRSREERKSLKEQECIERVTEFLKRHSIPSYSDVNVGLEMAEPSITEVVDEQLEQRVKRPSAISEEGETAGLSTTIETSIVSVKRQGSLKSVSEVVEDSLEDSKLAKDAKRLPESKRQRPILERAAAAVSEVPRQPESAVQEPVKRPSSLRKRRDSFSRESSRESLLEEKKGVRIQEDVQEIFFDDTSEQVSGSLRFLKNSSIHFILIVLISMHNCRVPDDRSAAGGPAGDRQNHHGGRGVRVSLRGGGHQNRDPFTAGSVCHSRDG